MQVFVLFVDRHITCSVKIGLKYLEKCSPPNIETIIFSTPQPSCHKKSPSVYGFMSPDLIGMTNKCSETFNFSVFNYFYF